MKTLEENLKVQTYTNKNSGKTFECIQVNFEQNIGEVWNTFRRAFEDKYPSFEIYPQLIFLYAHFTEDGEPSEEPDIQGILHDGYWLIIGEEEGEKNICCFCPEIFDHTFSRVTSPSK